jgi:dipeptidyl aminopeptidase/acylaminoacyl peptidase
VPRLAASYYKGIATIWYRDAEGQPWRKMHEAELNKLDVDPIMFDFDDRTLFVASGDDKLAIHVYDFQNNRVGERLARHLDVDMHEIEANEATRKILGFRYDAEKRGAVWIDQHVARLQQLVDKALPDRVNRLSVADENPKRALVMSYSDTVPAEFYVLDTENFKLAKLAASRPWIKPSEMSERKFVRYKSRDGLEIPGYLTIPRQTSGKNLPLVVVIHGGPWIRKHSFGFDVQAQFFASRGYAVFQPDYRGTIGYGNRHYTSGFEQWGLAMQDDITDGVEWLVRERIADKNRICLFGFNYGGYATLWGLIKTPELYRCGVTYGAITSIEQVFSFNARSPNVWDKDLERIRIGDPDRDGDKFRSLSPLYRVDGLKASVLVAFGAADQVVPVRHATAFRSALDRAGKKYEWALYTDEGRAFGSDENRFDFYRRVEVFLKQHLN